MSLDVETQKLMRTLAIVKEAEKHWATIETDYGLACKYCTDKAPERVVIMQPCLESERLLKAMTDPDFDDMTPDFTEKIDEVL